MKYPDAYHDTYSKTIFGFWLYLLTDFILFGTLFATYAVLQNSTFGGPTGKTLFNLPFTFNQTLVLLVASFTAGLGGACVHRKDKAKTIFYFVLTFVLGVIFLWMEWKEISHLLQIGSSWQKSAFLSAYYTIIATFLVHIVLGLIWIPVLLFPVWREGITEISMRRLVCLKLFWQFLNIVWVFIFSFIYLMAEVNA